MAAVCPPHRWRIEEQNGTPIVRGVCKNCGAERDYRASEDDMPSWNARPTLEESYGKRVRRKRAQGDHSGHLYVRCEKCGRSFLSGRGMTVHQKQGVCDRPPTHFCSCGRGFQTSASLRRHQTMSDPPHRSAA